MTGRLCFCQRRVCRGVYKGCSAPASRHFQMDIFEFVRYVSAGNDDMVADFQQHGLHQTFHCRQCGRPYSEVRWKGSLLGYQLYCLECRMKLNLSKDFMLKDMRIPLEKVYGLMYFCSYEATVNKTVTHRPQQWSSGTSISGTSVHGS